MKSAHGREWDRLGRWQGVLGRSWRGMAAGVAWGVTVAALVGGCGLVGGSTNFQADVPSSMTVTSPDISQVGGQGVLGPAYTCRGAGRHPGIHWSGAPQGTKSLALVMDDAAAPITPYIYWIVFDIGPGATGIQAGQIPAGVRQAINSNGSVGYAPPCPANRGHTYRFTVYALGSALKLPQGASTKAAWTAIARAAIARGRLLAVANP